jgi:hypothetical protein
MLLAAMLAMVLAAAAPALSQVAVGGDTTVLPYSCDEIQAALDLQYQRGEGIDAVAGAAQALDISQNQVLACFGTAVAAQQSTINVNTATADGGKKVHTVTAAVKAQYAGKAQYQAATGGGGSASAAAGGTLPETGGASLIALGAGALLVAGGLLARRIVR